MKWTKATKEDLSAIATKHWKDSDGSPITPSMAYTLFNRGEPIWRLDESPLCAICGNVIKETGASYNGSPVHIDCYHKATQEEEWIGLMRAQIKELEKYEGELQSVRVFELTGSLVLRFKRNSYWMKIEKQSTVSLD